MTTDILVIGTGISGLTFAIKVAEENPEISLTLISKGDINEGNTRYAQGGIAVVKNLKKDSTEKHIKDTMTAGDGTCDSKVVKFVVEEANKRLDELIKWGTAFDKKEEQLDLGIEGGHSEKRIVHYKDQTGKQIQEVLTAKVKSFSNITILENHTLVDLITDHHSKSKMNRCYGAYIISQEEEEIIKIGAKITILSTGGAGSLYAYTTNPSVATGDGLGAAYRAKVQMDGLPFVQFHPTALKDKIEQNVFLITEAVRGEGGKLRNSLRERFMLKIDSRGELAPRDIVAREIQKQIEKQEENFVLLDGSEISEERWKSHFPTIYNTCKSIGVFLPKDPIPVVPAAHYFCGGIIVNHQSESSLKGLYAIGEVACTGMHGANRLASNSLLEAVVFANRAADHFISQPSNDLQEVPKWRAEGMQELEEHAPLIRDLETLRKTMTDDVGIVRSFNRLERAKRMLTLLSKEVDLIWRRSIPTRDLIELRNLVLVATHITEDALNRKENRGLHWNKDLI